MGSWDCYCAICGGPFVGAEPSRKPRTARFRRKWAKKTKKHRERELPDDASVSSASEGEQDDDTTSLDAYEEDNSYDPQVISAEDVKWIETLHVLGFNVEAKGTSKAFVSGPGTYSDYGGVRVEVGSDPNIDGCDSSDFHCYYTWDSGNDPVYPFHWCCYELVAKRFTGSFDVDNLDKDLLYSIMAELSPELYSALDVGYGDVSSRVQEQFWATVPGYEYLVSHPRNISGVEELVLSMFGSKAFVALSSNTDTRERVRSDIFTKLPYDLVYRLSTMLPDADLFNLAQASWPIHALLRGVGQFWQQRLKGSMPWFFELHELLEQDQTILQESDPKRIYLWAEKITRPKRWMTGPFMGVANRRRIWSVCEELNERYQPRLALNDLVVSHADEMILKYSKCSSFVSTSGPDATKTDVVRNAYWIESWSEMHSQPNEFATFWDGSSLVGIAFGPYGVSREVMGQEWRLLGRDSSTGGIHGSCRRLEPSEWITAIILHIPPIDIFCLKRRALRDATDDEIGNVATSPRGLTAILNTGRTMIFGTTNRGYSQRFLPAAPNWCITGMTGMIGEVKGKRQLTRLGLLQAQNPGLIDYSAAPEPPIPPKPTHLQSLLWENNYFDLLHHDIWNHPTLRLVHIASHATRINQVVHPDLIAHEALIWAGDERDLRSLTRLSGFVVLGGTRLVLSRGMYGVHDVCGVNAEYTPESALMWRRIGINKNSPGSDMENEDPWMHFDIDGPGGEIVTEILYAMQEKPKAMKIRTNRGRECYWGEIDAQNWHSLTAPQGETLVGLVMSFAEPSGYDHHTKTYAHCKLSFVGALSMPLGTPEESQPVGQ